MFRLKRKSRCFHICVGYLMIIISSLKSFFISAFLIPGHRTSYNSSKKISRASLHGLITSKTKLFACWSTIATTTQKIINIEDNDITPSSPREWLEREIQSRNCTDGAYTVLRGEYMRIDDKLNSIQVLGQDYHLCRLQDSYRLLFNRNDKGDSLMFVEAVDTSTEIIGKLAELVAGSSKTENNFAIMLTLLWTPCPVSSRILVNGHIALVQTKNNLRPETACVALPPSNYHNKLEWPNRFNFIPTAKYVSWCFDRKLLEHLLLPHKIIFLVDKDENSILEATTSNIFVLYDDGVWRTNMNLALPGYAQDIIYKTIDKHTTSKIKSTSILLQESHCWKYVFVTSSVSLIQPVGKILIPVYTESVDNGASHKTSHYETLWEADHNTTIPEHFCRQIRAKITDASNLIVEKTQVYESID